MLDVSMRSFAPAALSLALMTSFAAGKAVETAGTIEAVTVYRGQALVTRAVTIAADGSAGGSKAADGVREIVVTDLPSQIVAASLHAEASDGTLVRSVRYRERPVSQDVREEVRTVDAKIEEIGRKQRVNQRKVELIGESKAYLLSMQNFVAPTASAELTKGVLNAETLDSLTTSMLARREKLAMEELALGNEAQELAALLDLAMRERQQLTAGSERTMREAVILLSGPAAPTLKLRYLVGNATWAPSYAVRSTMAAKDSVTVDYYAAVEQMSGEDWSDVAMTLSTATPSLVAKAPNLVPLVLTLSTQMAEPAAQQIQLGYMEARKALSDNRVRLENMRAQTINAPVMGGDILHVQADDKSKDGPIKFDRQINENAASIQILDFVSSEKLERGRDSASGVPKPATEEGLSVTYAINGEASLPSRADRQLIQIASMPLKAEFAKVATPVLTSFVYNEAEIRNTSSTVLLAGPVTAYVDGAFVGGSELPTIASGESFVVGLGIDSSLRASHELLARSESIQGGNRVVELTYRLAIENFSETPSQVRLIDRLPQTKDGQVRVTAGTMPATSTDEEYVKTQKKAGILRWDVTVPANARGTESFITEFSFKLEYDKQMNLAGI